MTISGYSSAIVDGMLGWLKGLANWVLRLFNLAGSGSGSPLLWLSENWLKLLVILIILGLGVDLLVWLIRWRPYWVWFRKERVIINDDKFFRDADLESDDDEWEDGILAANWDERNYVVTSKEVRRQNRPAHNQSTVVETRRARNAESDLRRPASNGARKKPAGDLKRSQAAPAAPGRKASAKRPSAAGKSVQRRNVQNDDSLFDVDTNMPDACDFYEDEVFNVSNLPISDEFSDDDLRF